MCNFCMVLFQIYYATIYIFNWVYFLNMIIAATLVTKSNKSNNGGDYMGYILATFGLSVF